MKTPKAAIGFSVVLLSLFFFVAIPEQASAEFELDFEFEFLEKWSKTDKDGNEKVSIVASNLALLCLIIAITYPLCRFIMRFSNTREDDSEDKFSSFLSLHIIFSMLAFFFMLIHSYYAEAISVYLILAIILMVGLVIVGCLMRYVPNIDLAQKETLLHTQRYFFWSFLFMIILGHVLVMG